MDWNKVRLAAAIGPLAVLIAVAPALGDDLPPPEGPSRPTRVRPSEDKAEHSRPDALTSAKRRGRLTQAEYSLERARSLFSLGAVRDEYGRVRRPNSHAATLILRDLAMSLNRLSGADAREARRLLARPTDGSKDPGKDGYTVGKNKQEHKCFDGIIGPAKKFPMCLHWVTASKDKATQSYVSEATGTLKVVATLELDDFGFKHPRPDGESKNHGPNDNLDIYLADLGGQGVYGYCTTDQPKAIKKQKVSAYCVLDNDYSPEQFDAPPPEVNGTDALEITAAHEFFHAVQFAYDWKEARWLMEGTAVAMEDEIFDDVNAHLAFIEDGPMHQPEIPLDAYTQSDDGENFEYGAWLFFRYMSELYCEHTGGPADCSDPEIIKITFEQADDLGVTGIQAVRLAFVETRPFEYFFEDAFAYFGVWNYAAWDYDGSNFYEEVDSYRDTLGGTGPPLDAFYHLLAADSETAEGELTIDGLATRYVSFWPGYGSANGDLTVSVDLPGGFSGAGAMLMHNPLVPGQVNFIPLDINGDGLLTVDYFNQDPAFSEVVLVLSNAGTADNQSFKYSATTVSD